MMEQCSPASHDDKHGGYGGSRAGTCRGCFRTEFICLKEQKIAHMTARRERGHGGLQNSYCFERPLWLGPPIFSPLNSSPILFSEERVAFGPWNIWTVHSLGFGPVRFIPPNYVTLHGQRRSNRAGQSLHAINQNIIIPLTRSDMTPAFVHL